MGQSKMTEYKTVALPDDPFKREWIRNRPKFAIWEQRRRRMARRPGLVGQHTGEQRPGAPGGQTTEDYLLFNDGGPESKRKPY